MKLWFDVKKDSIDRTGKSETTYKKHNQDNVWKGGCEVNGLRNKKQKLVVLNRAKQGPRYVCEIH